MQWRTAILTWLTLMLLLGGSVAAAVLIPGAAWSAVLNAACATAMAALILTFFMRLKEASALLRTFALGGLLWVAFLLFLTLLDVLTR